MLKPHLAAGLLAAVVGITALDVSPAMAWRCVNPTTGAVTLTHRCPYPAQSSSSSSPSAPATTQQSAPYPYGQSNGYPTQQSAPYPYSQTYPMTGGGYYGGGAYGGGYSNGGYSDGGY